MSPGGSDYFTCIQNMKLFTNKFKSGGLHGKHVVATWNLGYHLSVCLQTQGNQENPVSRWQVAGPSEYRLTASSPASKVKKTKIFRDQKAGPKHVDLRTKKKIKYTPRDILFAYETKKGKLISANRYRQGTPESSEENHLQQ